MQIQDTLEDVTNGLLVVAVLSELRPHEPHSQSVDELSRLMVSHRFSGTISGVQLTVVHRHADFAMLNANASVVTQVLSQAVRQRHPLLEECQQNAVRRPQRIHYRSQVMHRLIQFLVRAAEAVLTAYLATLVLTRD